MTHLKIIVPFYNAERFLVQCQESLLAQNFKNWQAILADDCSTDMSNQKVINHSSIRYRKNHKRTTALENIHSSILEAKPDDEDVICLLDGDDFLFRNNALSIVNDLYQDDTLLTYGQYIWPNGMVGHCRAYTEESFKTLRTGGYWASHIRTFKYKLYKELVKQDNEMSCYKDDQGEYFKTCYDIAIMTPLMEMAGFDKIKFNPDPVYFYRIHPQNDHVVDASKQKSDEKLLFSKKPFKQVF